MCWGAQSAAVMGRLTVNASGMGGLPVGTRETEEDEGDCSGGEAIE